MARESELWQRCKNGAKSLRQDGHLIDLQRVENLVGCGHPDVEGCIDGRQVWIELKSCSRPARPDTPIRPKARMSQEIWHAERVKSGCRCNWILIQVGEGSESALYLIPGNRYADIKVPESQLKLLSAVPRHWSLSSILWRAAEGW